MSIILCVPMLMLIKWHLNKSVFAIHKPMNVGNKFPLPSSQVLVSCQLSLLLYMTQLMYMKNRISYLELQAGMSELIIKVLILLLIASGRRCLRKYLKFVQIIIKRVFDSSNFSIAQELIFFGLYLIEWWWHGICPLIRIVSESKSPRKEDVIKIYIRWSVAPPIKHIKSHNKMDVSH